MNNSAAKTWSVGPGVAATGPAGRHVKVPQKREHVSSSSSNPTFTIAASSSGATEAQPLALPQSSATKYQQSASAHIRSCSPSSSACRCHFRHTAADAPLGAVRGAYVWVVTVNFLCSVDTVNPLRTSSPAPPKACQKSNSDFSQIQWKWDFRVLF